ncbi:MAG: hypothetical protein ACQEVT_09165 [Pseudomonadota bacterium]|nr:hypothetical protein [Roseovarius sp. EGI FJ00037]
MTATTISAREGQTSGQNAPEFANIVGALNDLIGDDRSIAALYRARMARKHTRGFNAKTLNVGVLTA